ncbi:adenylate/guanylate cyclase domain-containing protein [Arcobacter sp. CECT 8983]|uniref:CHASE2 domain-containing protein n=1 Tax=Arcobacter sp. CECT 8983 TaxID=2044508 RepID=UPI00100B839A|nr:adenylate/guanylate cyclase domain-containing protein [Arcobacter sp. CECT 8983]RXJ89527.1 adenylate/guanylate cyclase domain-containing protein [Arcobacter sp. CECT 8983]
MKFLIRHKLLFFFISFILLTFSYLNFDEVTSNFDEKIREIFFEIRGEIPTTNKVVIIDIDEKSINQLGQWPFSRDYMAQVLANLTNAGAGIIGVDIIFSEADRSSPSYMSRKLNVKGEFRDNDQLLAAVISQTPTILGYYFTKDLSKNSKPTPVTKFTPNSSPHLLNFKNVVTSISPIQENAYSSGFFNAFNDQQGKIIKMPLLLQHKDKIYPSLVFEMINIASNTQNVKIVQDNYAISGVKLSNIDIPTDKHGFMRINFRGAKKSFKYISFLDILNGNFDKNDINGKFILIGTSITTLADLRSTIYDLAMPGVEIHANMIDNILKGDFLYEPTFGKAIDILIIFILTVILGVSLLFLSSINIVIVIVVLTTILYSCFYYLLFSQGLILNLFYPIVSIIITSLSAFYINYQKEQKQKEFIKDKFAKKVSLEVVNDLLSNDNNDFKTKEKELTIFFSDIRGFTNISEKFKSPQKLIEVLNKYFEPMSDVIIQNQGTIDKFIGDAIMAYWNAPCDIENHADKAVQSALIQLEKLKNLNEELKKDFNLSIQIGIGIHTGIAVVGEMGSEGRSDYTIIGDNVNITSRVESLCKYFGVDLLITESTKTSLKQKYHLKYLGKVIVKGKTTAIKLYEVLLPKDFNKYQDIKEDYEKAIKHYQDRNFAASKIIFEKIEDTYSSKINKLYIKKCHEHINAKKDNIVLDFVMDEK